MEKLNQVRDLSVGIITSRTHGSALFQEVNISSFNRNSWFVNFRAAN